MDTTLTSLRSVRCEAAPERTGYLISICMYVACVCVVCVCVVWCVCVCVCVGVLECSDGSVGHRVTGLHPQTLGRFVLSLSLSLSHTHTHTHTHTLKLWVSLYTVQHCSACAYIHTYIHTHPQTHNVSVTLGAWVSGMIT